MPWSLVVIAVHTKYKCIYLLTYSMAQSPSWAASQEIPRISRNPKVHYRTHKRLPPVSILGQHNPVHIPTSHLLQIILILSTHLRLGLPSGLFPSGFPIKTLYATCPAHLTSLSSLISDTYEIQIMYRVSFCEISVTSMQNCDMKRDILIYFQSHCCLHRHTYKEPLQGLRWPTSPPSQYAVR